MRISRCVIFDGFTLDGFYGGVQIDNDGGFAAVLFRLKQDGDFERVQRPAGVTVTSDGQMVGSLFRQRRVVSAQSALGIRQCAMQQLLDVVFRQRFKSKDLAA